MYYLSKCQAHEPAQKPAPFGARRRTLAASTLAEGKQSTLTMLKSFGSMRVDRPRSGSVSHEARICAAERRRKHHQMLQRASLGATVFDRFVHYIKEERVIDLAFQAANPQAASRIRTRGGQTAESELACCMMNHLGGGQANALTVTRGAMLATTQSPAPGNGGHTTVSPSPTAGGGRGGSAGSRSNSNSPSPIHHSKKDWTPRKTGLQESPSPIHHSGRRGSGVSPHHRNPHGTPDPEASTQPPSPIARARSKSPTIGNTANTATSPSAAVARPSSGGGATHVTTAQKTFVRQLETALKSNRVTRQNVQDGMWAVVLALFFTQEFAETIHYKLQLIKAMRLFTLRFLPMMQRAIAVRRKKDLRAILTVERMGSLARPSPDQLRGLRGKFFAEWSDIAVSNAIGGLVPIAFNEGEFIMHAGDYDTQLYILVEGSVDIIIRKKGINSKKRNKETAGACFPVPAPAYFGEFALLCKEPRSASIQCTAPCKCWMLYRPLFEEQLPHLDQVVRDHINDTADKRRTENLRNYFRLKKEMLQKVSLFEHWPSRLQDKLLEALEPRVLQSGVVLYEEGDRSNDIFILSEGKVEVLSRARQRRFALHPGECFGAFEGIFARQDRAFTAKTLTKCDLWYISHKNFIGLAVEDCDALIETRNVARRSQAELMLYPNTPPYFIAKDPLLNYCLSQNAIAALWSIAAPQVYLKDEYICSEVDVCDALIGVTAGTIKIRYSQPLHVTLRTNVLAASQQRMEQQHLPQIYPHKSTYVGRTGSVFVDLAGVDFGKMMSDDPIGKSSFALGTSFSTDGGEGYFVPQRGGQQPEQRSARTHSITSTQMKQMQGALVSPSSTDLHASSSPSPGRRGRRQRRASIERQQQLQQLSSGSHAVPTSSSAAATGGGTTGKIVAALQEIDLVIVPRKGVTVPQYDISIHQLFFCHVPEGESASPDGAHSGAMKKRAASTVGTSTTRSKTTTTSNPNKFVLTPIALGRMNPLRPGNATHQQQQQQLQSDLVTLDLSNVDSDEQQQAAAAENIYLHPFQALFPHLQHLFFLQTSPSTPNALNVCHVGSPYSRHTLIPCDIGVLFGAYETTTNRSRFTMSVKCMSTCEAWRMDRALFLSKLTPGQRNHLSDQRRAAVVDEAFEKSNILSLVKGFHPNKEAGATKVEQQQQQQSQGY